VQYYAKREPKQTAAMDNLSLLFQNIYSQ